MSLARRLRRPENRQALQLRADRTSPWSRLARSWQAKDRRRPANRRTAGTRRRRGQCRNRGPASSQSAAGQQPRAYGFDRVVQQHRAAIAQPLGKRRVVARGILVEQPPHVGFGHGRRHLAGAEPRQLQPGAVIVLGVGVARLLESGDSAVAVAELVADGAEREPGRGEAWRQLDRLRQNIGGAGKIALGDVIERPFVAPVGDQVAGGDEERAGIRHSTMLAWRSEMTIYDSRCDLKTYWCRRRPASAANWAPSISTRRGRSSGR